MIAPILFQRFAVDALRAAVVLALALSAVLLLRRRSPAARRIVLTTALAGVLVMPLASAVAPEWVPSPVANVALRAREVTESLVAGHASVRPPGAAASSSSPAPAVGTATRSHLDVTTVAGILWALGALAVLARLAVGLVRSRGLVRRSAPAVAWSTAVDRAERLTGLRARVRRSIDLGAPAVTGIVRSVVLVPAASDDWDDERRVSVLLHELAHVRQRDCLVHVVGQLACALHWFDPLVWIAARRLRFERELSADDAVLACGARPSSYAEHLLAIASTTWPGGEAPSGALGMGGRSDLKARITAIVSTERPGRSPSHARAAALVAATAAPILALACTAPTGTAGTPSTASTPRDEVWTSTASSTVQSELQKIADEELDRGLAESGGEEALALVLDPSTGEIVADAGRSHGAPADVAVRNAYFTGSTMKAVTLAAALDDGVVTPDERFDCGQGSWTAQGKVMQDPHEDLRMLTLPEMLAVSSNIGFARVGDRIGGPRLLRWFHAFHFGEAPVIEGATAGAVPERIEEHSFAVGNAAIGEAVQASPLQMAAAYATLANGGEYVAPTRQHRAGPAPRERLMKAETAKQVVTMLENVVYAEHATGRLAQVDGVRVGGKTGTAELELPDGKTAYYASFVGIVPTTAPRYVIIVGVLQPKVEGGGGQIAAPVFSRIATRALAMR
jgi:beta-lactamase regulating signal transducer with metallopeptidase domain